jgi:uncharacterized SAM-binding protein YcdF (DUF218 family)
MRLPRSANLIENRSTNTAENIVFTKALLEQKNIHPNSFLLVQKPYMERRSYATFENFWPGKSVRVTSPQLSFEDYITPEFPIENVINIMVGDLQRIKVYPARGFQVYQEIPNPVWEACQQLIALGFDKQLIND